MTYYQLLCLEAKTNENLDPPYTRRHLTVDECYPDAPDGDDWDDTAPPEIVAQVHAQLGYNPPTA